ncbi:hypothetical protein I7I51_01535, partial [Histoplasma capsulatum]
MRAPGLDSGYLGIIWCIRYCKPQDIIVPLILLDVSARAPNPARAVYLTRAILPQQGFGVVGREGEDPKQRQRQGGTTSQVSGLDCALQIYWENWENWEDWGTGGLRDCETVRLRYAPGKMAGRVLRKGSQILRIALAHSGLVTNPASCSAANQPFIAGISHSFSFKSIPLIKLQSTYTVHNYLSAIQENGAMELFPSVERGNGSTSPSPVAAQLPPVPPTNKYPPPSTRSDRASKPSDTSPAASSRLRSASLIFLESNPPSGMWMATGDIASRAPTLNEIRAGCFSADGWTEEGQIQRFKLSRANTSVPRVAVTKSNALKEQEQTAHLRRSNTAPSWNSGNDTITITGGKYMKQGDDCISRQSTERPLTLSVKSAIDTKSAQAASPPRIPDETGTYPNGYRFPPKHTWSQATIIGLKAFGRFVITPFGLLVTVYGLNIVAWGAMIFFLLLNAAPALCNSSCSASNSARKIWIEIDSQILNALFCVTGFGLIPWRFRDFYYLLQWPAATAAAVTT